MWWGGVVGGGVVWVGGGVVVVGVQWVEVGGEGGWLEGAQQAAIRVYVGEGWVGGGCAAGEGGWGGEVVRVGGGLGDGGVGTDVWGWGGVWVCWVGWGLWWVGGVSGESRGGDGGLVVLEMIFRMWI